MDVFRILRAPSERCTPSFGLIYLISVIFTFHTLLTAYSSSTYLEAFISAERIGLLYALAAFSSIALFLTSSVLLRRFGNTLLTLIFALIAVIALVLVGAKIAPLVAFVVFLAINPILYLNIDVFAESAIGDNEHETGRRRGLTLSLMSAASVFAPLAMGFLAGDDNTHLARTYFAAAGVGALFMIIVALRLRRFRDPTYGTINLRDACVRFFRDRNIRGTLAAHFLLQFFFAWIVIYFPLYLATDLGLSFETIGTIISVGLIAYVLCEYPIGILADRVIGEKEMMALGFLILALSSASISFLAGVGTLAWMGVMFASRIGASLVEVTTESHFFKQINGGDTNLIGLFRITRPLANLVGALVGSLCLMVLPMHLMFIALGLVMVPGILLTLTITDTR